MWGGPAKIKDIERYPYKGVCNTAKLIPAGPRNLRKLIPAAEIQYSAGMDIFYRIYPKRKIRCN
jgi:hypothetical protein